MSTRGSNSCGARDAGALGIIGRRKDDRELAIKLRPERVHRPLCGQTKRRALLLLRFIGVTCVDLLQVNHLRHDVEPNSGVSGGCRLVLPASMSSAVASHCAKLTLKGVIGWRGLQRSSREEIP